MWSSLVKLHSSAAVALAHRAKWTDQMKNLWWLSNIWKEVYQENEILIFSSFLLLWLFTLSFSPCNSYKLKKTFLNLYPNSFSLDLDKHQHLVPNIVDHGQNLIISPSLHWLHLIDLWEQWNPLHLLRLLTAMEWVRCISVNTYMYMETSLIDQAGVTGLFPLSCRDAEGLRRIPTDSICHPRAGLQPLCSLELSKDKRTRHAHLKVMGLFFLSSWRCATSKTRTYSGHQGEVLPDPEIPAAAMLTRPCWCLCCMKQKARWSDLG